MADAIPNVSRDNPIGATSAWVIAVRNYEAKRKYCDELPLDDEPAGDLAVEAYCDAQDHLVENLPSPDREALLFKMQLGRERWESTELPVAWHDAYVADIRRLFRLGETK